MSIGEWSILGVGIITIISFVIIVIKASVHVKSLDTKGVNKEQFVCFEGVVITKKVIGCRTEGLYLPETMMQFGCFFLLKTGEEKFYLVPECVFHQLKEQATGNLYIKNNMFFDFEEIEKRA